MQAESTFHALLVEYSNDYLNETVFETLTDMLNFQMR